MSVTILDSIKPDAVKKPCLSHSKIDKYLTCPEKYRLYYLEGWRPRFPPANLVFGQAVHQSLAKFFKETSDPIQCFQRYWLDVKEVDLGFSNRQTWNILYERGQALLEKFVQEESQHITNIEASEEVFELSISNLDLPFIGIIDLIAEVDGNRAVIDFKTSGTSYLDYEANLSDQLTAYNLARPDISRCALCVLVKTKEPKIEWHITTRTGNQMSEYLSKVDYVAHEIELNHFYKRPGRWCSYCDFLPICLGNYKQIEDTLMQIG